MRNQAQTTLYMFFRRGALFFAVVIASLAIPTHLAKAQAYHWPMHMGVRCQADFQNDWAPSFNANAPCHNFINQISSTDHLDFAYNLIGGAPAFAYTSGEEACSGCGGVDSVDFFLLNTHGGLSSNNADTAGFAMWDYYSTAWTEQMRLGASGEEVKVFANYACDTMKTSDGRFWSRWSSPMSGGVKIVTGAHDLVYDDSDSAFTSFAQRIQNGQAIGGAWLEAVWYGDNDNHPSEANTGATANDCWNRAGATMQSVQTMNVLRDNQIGYICWAGWNGD